MTRWHGKTTKQRGYAGQHPKLRAQWEPLVQAGQVSCHATICLMPSRWIPPDQPGQRTGWHLGHTPDRQAWTGPEHERCNIAEANRRRASRRWQQPARWVTSRSWLTMRPCDRPCDHARPGKPRPASSHTSPPWMVTCHVHAGQT